MAFDGAVLWDVAGRSAWLVILLAVIGYCDNLRHYSVEVKFDGSFGYYVTSNGATGMPRITWETYSFLSELELQFKHL